jgi:hypothetical protein
VWAELERLGIRPGGIDESAAKPPLPAERGTMQMPEVDEAIPVQPLIMQATESAPRDGITAPAELRTRILQAERTILEHVLAPLPITKGEPDPEVNDSASTQVPHSAFGSYVAYRGPAGPHPRSASPTIVADSLCRIVEVEGPMLAKRSYDIYLRGCGIRRLGGELKSAMNKALAKAIQEGRVVSENEPGKSGLIYSTIRIKGTAAIKLRTRGPRSFDEIPPGELRAAATSIFEATTMQWGSDEHLRAILELFDLKRMTAQVRARLLEILEAPGDEITIVRSANQTATNPFEFDEPKPSIH